MNINEIAKLAGVSRATVSRYLNDGYVSEEKRKQIKEIIDQTGYVPSMQAQNLRNKKTKLIGVIIPKINSESISNIVSGISLVLKEQGYQLLLANTENHEKEEIKYLKLFSENQVDGIILLGTIFTRTHQKLMRELQVPIAILGQKVAGYSCVYQDDYNAAREITQTMCNSGAKIAYIGVTDKDVAVGQQRKKGFLKALEEAKIQIRPEWMTETGFSVEGGYEKAKELWSKEANLDSCFCATDNIALGVMMYLSEQGIQVPEQVQIVGMGDSTMSQVYHPQLSTVHFHYQKSGMEVASLLMELLADPQSIQKQIKMGYEVMSRNSIRP